MGIQPSVGMIGKSAERPIVHWVSIRLRLKLLMQRWSNCPLLQMEISLHAHTEESASHIQLDAKGFPIGAKDMTRNDIRERGQ